MFVLVVKGHYTINECNIYVYIFHACMAIGNFFQIKVMKKVFLLYFVNFFELHGFLCRP